MILGWSSFKVSQMVPVRCIPRSQVLKIDFLTKNIKKSYCQKPLDRFQYNFAEMFLWCSFGDPLPRLFKPFGFVKKHGRQGAGLIFPIYLYRKIKKSYCPNHWTDFNIILQKCSFGDPLPRLFKPFGFVKKHGRLGAGLIFPIYRYRKV